jgi:hypothetical protein
MVTALAATVLLRWVAPFSGSGPVVFAKTALTTTLATTLVWVIVTLVTGPEPQEVLISFYRKVRPELSGWRPIAALAPEIPTTHDLGRNLLSWVLGCAMVYATLFGLGHLLLGPFSEGALLLVFAAACAVALYANLSRTGWKEEEVPSVPVAAKAAK